jgi:hypothetical protein
MFVPDNRYSNRAQLAHQLRECVLPWEVIDRTLTDGASGFSPGVPAEH